MADAPAGIDGRAHRLDAELASLTNLARVNPGIITVASVVRGALEDRIEVRLEATPAPCRPLQNPIRWRTSHTIVIVFDSMFPLVPLEIYISDPPAHPNISPDDGFICLWEDFRPERTVTEGLVAVRNILTWESLNELEVHEMQPGILPWVNEVRASRSSDWPKLHFADGGFRN